MSDPAAECPVPHGQLPYPTQGDANQVWWPNKLNLKILAKHGEKSNPVPGIDYKALFVFGNFEPDTPSKCLELFGNLSADPNDRGDDHFLLMKRPPS